MKQGILNFKSKYIGDRNFYKGVLAVAIPMMVQNGITNLVSLLDNIMVGRLGTEAMSGISIVNQFIFIFNLLIFGAVSAAGIFTAQYYGLGDNEGIKHTFRFKFIVNLAAALIGIAVFLVFDEPIINLFLFESDSTGDLALTMNYGKEYLYVMLIGLVPYAISQVYASTMRETGDSVIPMVASIVAVVTNFFLNIILIFGYLGFPALGVVGAAIATVVSRFAELITLTVYAHTHKDKFPYLKGAYSSPKISRELFGRITVKGIPLMLNEFFWAIAMTMRNQCYSTRGLDVVAAQNISTTVFNLFSVVYMALGSSVAIIIGKQLGAGERDEAIDTQRKLTAFSIFSGTVMMLFMIGASFLFPKIYNTTDTVRSLAAFMMIISGIGMPFSSFANAAYFTLRSGGRVFITVLFDSVYMWAVVMPVSIVFSYFTDISIFLLFPICQWVDSLKVIFGAILLKRGNWARTLVTKTEEL
ncbi:MAG: MATE family efflux transporter [Clostridia bacterium]|nr:MATE family efflux transporter [Clostridia bacterium]